MELSLARKATTTPMRLKDFLVDELSSCSSNGFRSYPRRPRQCRTITTTTIRLIDLQLKNPKPQTFRKSSFSVSVFQRASNALFNAVKLHLHIPLHKKLIKQCFSKKRIEKVEIPIAIDASRRGVVVVDEKSSFSPDLSFTMSSGGGCSSISSVGSNIGESNYSWSGSDFTVSDQEYLRCSKVIDEVKKLKKKSKGIVVCDQDCVEAISDASSSTSTSNPRPFKTEDEKEQLSPVSVLDCPFEDDQDEDEVSSTFQPRHARSKGSKKRLGKKAQKLEGITKLEPNNLEKCIALSECVDYESSRAPSSDECKAIDNDENIDAERKAFELLQLMRRTLPSTPIMNVEDEKLLLDFFMEGINEMRGVRINAPVDDELLSYAMDWMKGKTQEVVLRNEDVKKKMEACLVDIEKETDWRKWDDGKKELVLELEAEVLASLLNEMLH